MSTLLYRYLKDIKTLLGVLTREMIISNRLRTMNMSIGSIANYQIIINKADDILDQDALVLKELFEGGNM